jgi:glucosylceramidase
MSFLDDTGGPYTGPLPTTCCDTQFMAPAGNLDAFRTTLDHYLYGQLSKWVNRGAVVLGSDQTSTEVSDVAFRDPDGTVVVAVANGAGAPRSIAVSSSDGVLQDTLPAYAVATYRWPGGPVVPDARDGTWRIVNAGNPTVALQVTGDAYGTTGARQVVASPVAWNGLDQRWRITYAGNGYYRVTSAAQPSLALHNTGDRYLTYPDVFAVAATPGSWLSDEQLWQIQDLGNGTYRFVSRAQGTVLQSTGDTYGGYPDVVHAVASPTAWNLGEQTWRLAAP